MPQRDRLEITGPSGPIENTFLRQGGSRLAVVLPGRRGGWTTAAVRAGRAAGDYEQVVLAGKSLGTLVMAELISSDPRFAGAPSIWLTPLVRDDRVASALRRLDAPALIVIGTEDSHHDPDVLSEMESRAHRVLVLAGAHHGLAIDGDALGSAEIPRALVRAVLDYLRDRPVALA